MAGYRRLGIFRQDHGSCHTQGWPTIHQRGGSLLLLNPAFAVIPAV